MKGVFTIGIDRRFADELARGVLAEHAADPLALADMLILVPTRRSVRALREAFLRASGGKPTILPRMAPLGDIDESEWEDLAGDAASLALPPAIDSVEREALLAQLVARFRDDGGEAIAQTPAQALKLARELASLLDELAIDGVPFDRLEGLVDGNFSQHWLRTIEFLKIIGKMWPEILTERGQIDALDRRTRIIRAQAERWRHKPPQTSVIAAGSTGSQPATRELLATIARLPYGTVVLPGLDREMDEESWAAVDANHPQFGLRELLGALGCTRSEVAEWPGSTGAPIRRRLIADLMRPAETSDSWTRPEPQRARSCRPRRLRDTPAGSIGDRDRTSRGAAEARTDGSADHARPRSCPPCRRRVASLGYRDRRFRRNAFGRLAASNAAARPSRRRRQRVRTHRLARTAETSTRQTRPVPRRASGRHPAS